VPTKLAAAIHNLLAARLHAYEAFHEGVLGTSLELQLRVERRPSGALAEAAALAEVKRLAAVFDRRAPGSELHRWAETFQLDVPVSRELALALRAAEHWHQRTAGAFDAAVGMGRRPLHAPPPVGGPAPAPPWALRHHPGAGGSVARRTSGSPVDLDALAKGLIVDRACAAAAAAPGVRETLLNIGGDLRHIGSRPVRVAITDPRADAENAQPLTHVRIRDQGVATSGAYRRGRRLDGRLLSHIVDPRSGDPAGAVLSASVLAPSAMTADALATAFNILPPRESLAIADSLAGVGCFLVDTGGGCHRNAFWSSHEG
jgi:FAD:protein FMN transferase